MLTIKNYIRAKSLEEAYELNQKKTNRIIGGMLWMKMSNASVNTVIDLCDLGLDKIEENEEEFSIGATVTLRDLELHEGLNRYTDFAVRDAVKNIVGVQFRNLATVGGSIWGRFGFSDVLTVFLTARCFAELYNAGIVPLEEFAQNKYPNDILVRIIVKKEKGNFVYSAMRNQSTDFPILTCAVSVINGTVRTAIGARPGKAILITDDETEVFKSVKNYAENVSENIHTESNNQGSAEYRKHLASVLLRRNLEKLGGQK